MSPRLPLAILLRDLLLVVFALALLTLSHRLDATGTGDALRIPVAILAGALLTLAAFLVHEWGHLLGALASRSVVHLPASAATLFLFRFDTGLNDRRQFLWMSAGGFIASALVLVALPFVLDLEYLADRIALGLVVLGVVATFILEVPSAWRVRRGAPLPEGAVFVRGAGRSD